jgi:hypothetical protein
VKIRSSAMHISFIPKLTRTLLVRLWCTSMPDANVRQSSFVHIVEMSSFPISLGIRTPSEKERIRCVARSDKRNGGGYVVVGIGLVVMEAANVHRISEI